MRGNWSNSQMCVGNNPPRRDGVRAAKGAEKRGECVGGVGVSEKGMCKRRKKVGGGGMTGVGNDVCSENNIFGCSVTKYMCCRYK